MNWQDFFLKREKGSSFHFPEVWQKSIALVLFLWVLVAGLYMAKHDSMTTDEGIHIASGYTILTRHDYRFDPEHPPVFKVITAIPVLFLHPNLPPDDQNLWDEAKPTFFDSWRQSREWADQWFYKSGNNANEMIFVARIPGVLTLLGLCWLVYAMAKRLFNPTVALFALFFTAFNPTILAHGHLANDDVPIAFAILLCIYTIWNYCTKPTIRNAVWIGLSLALSLGIKYTALGLIPLVLIFLVITHLKTKSLKTFFGHLGVVALVTYVSLWAIYSFQSPLLIDGSLQSLVQQASPHARIDPDKVIRLARILHYIIPSEFAKGFILVQISTIYGRGAYLLGQHYWPSIWFYFPVAYALKTQVAGLLLLLIGLKLAWKPRLGFLKNPSYQVLGASLLVFTALSIVNKLDLGVRHIMIIMVLLSFYMALTTQAILDKSRGWKLLPILALWYVIPVLIQFPNTLGFTNELVQPYSKGYLYLNDSNLDWGQQSQEIAWTVEHQFSGETVATSYPWSPYALNYYGVKTIPFDPAHPPTKTLIMVTANQLSNPDYASFLNRTPIARIANNTYFYRLN